MSKPRLEFFDIFAPVGTGQRAAGFSLLEMVVCISLIAFIIMGIIGLIPTGLKSLTHADQVQAATLYGTEVLEDAIYDVQSNPSASLGSTTSSFSLNRTDYSVQKSVTRVDNVSSPMPVLVEIDVGVSWNGHPQPVMLSTRVYVSQ